MFKCKINLEEFDKDIKSGAKAELAETRNLAKACVKKLASAEETKTPFFLSKNYFEEKGKPVGSFLAFGENKKLEMKFAKEEIKGKGSTKDAKGAAYGEAYVKTNNNIQFIYFEPAPACKVPANAWPKLLKSLKPMFGGMKALVVIEGQTIEEEAGEEENAENVVVEAPKAQVSENDKNTETKEERLKRKALGAKTLLIEIENLKTIYAMDKKEKLLRKTTKWLGEYALLDESQKSDNLNTDFKTIQEADAKIKEIIKKDKMISAYMEQIFGFINQYLKSNNPQEAQQLGQKVKQAIEKVKPMIIEIQDKDLLDECIGIQQLL